MRTIDWSQNHWNYGRREPCHLCGQPSMLTDDARRPAHKACVEHAAGLREHDPQSGHFPTTSETLTTTADRLIAMVIDTMGPGTQVVKEPRPRTFGPYAKLRDPEPELGFQVELGFQLESFEVLAFVGLTGCPECGDPLDGPALIKRCQPNHKAATASPPHSSKKLRPTRKDNGMTTNPTTRRRNDHD